MRIAKEKHRQTAFFNKLLDRHVRELVAIDFFTVPTTTFRILFVFVVFTHYHGRVFRFNVTEHSTAFWTAQQMVEAFAEDITPCCLLRGRDKIYGDHFRGRIWSMGIKEVTITPRSLWQKAIVERLAGSIRREWLDHVIIFGDRHLRNILMGHFDYY